MGILVFAVPSSHFYKKKISKVKIYKVRQEKTKDKKPTLLFLGNFLQNIRRRLGSKTTLIQTKWINKLVEIVNHEGKLKGSLNSSLVAFLQQRTINN